VALIAAGRSADPASAREPATKRGTSCAANPLLFGAGSWPPGCWRPYAAQSPFNRALSASPRLHPKSPRIVRRTLDWGQPQSLVVGQQAGGPGDYGHPVYYSSGTDPVYTIKCLRWTSGCEVDGMRVRIPRQARPARGSDAHLAVVDAGSDWEYDFWEVQTVPLPASGGTVRVGHGGRTRWGTSDSDGLGSNATAAHFALGAGVLRAEEWSAATSGGGAINHALFVAVRCTSGDSVYPAAPHATGTVCDSKRQRASAPPLGARYYLDMTAAEIDALQVPAWKKPILKAMSRYGMIVGDTIGGKKHSFGIWAESDIQYTSLGHAGRYAELGRQWGAPTYDGAYIFDMASGVAWRQHLRVVAPCVSHGTC
jgi:hypothetical protein